MFSFQERNVSSFSIRGNVLTLQTAHRNLLILCQIVLHPYINFLISKKNKTPKTDPKTYTCFQYLHINSKNIKLH